jgi:hypothetical protein
MSIDLTKFNLGRLHTFIYLNPVTTGNSASIFIYFITFKKFILNDVYFYENN